MKDYERFMELALSEAGRAVREGEVPVGAVLEHEGRVIARDHNRCIQLSDPTAHAEMLVLREGARTIGNYRLNGANLYVTVEPCPMCAGAIINSRIMKVIYGARDTKAGADGSVLNILRNKKFNHRAKVIEGIMKEKCREILQDFFRKRRSRNSAGYKTSCKI